MSLGTGSGRPGCLTGAITLGTAPFSISSSASPLIDPVSGSKRRHDAACATREGHIAHAARLREATYPARFAIPAGGWR